MTTRLQRDFGTATNNKIFTISVWIKKQKVANTHTILCGSGSSHARPTPELTVGSDGKTSFYSYNGSGYDVKIRTNRLFKDLSGWYHIVMAVDTTQSTASNRIKIYVNGEQETSFSPEDYPSQNLVLGMNNNTPHCIGGSTFGGYNGGNELCLMSHYHFADGTAYTPSTFGETDSTTGEWKIKADPSFTLGNNGFTILKDGNTITDQSTNSNNFTLGTGTLTKTEDCPSSVFATMNPLDKHIGGTAPTFSNGNNTWSSPGNGSSNAAVKGTIGASSGKYYFEAKFTAAQYTNAGMSLVDGTNGWNGDGDIAGQSSFYGIQAGGNKRVAGTNTSSVFTALSNNDIGMFAYDFDNNKFWFGVNGSWVASGNPTTGANSLGTLASGIYLPSVSNGYWTAVSTVQFNFGNGYFGTTAVSSAGTNASNNGIFEYNVPSGYTALSTKGLNL